MQNEIHHLDGGVSRLTFSDSSCFVQTGEITLVCSGLYFCMLCGDVQILTWVLKTSQNDLSIGASLSGPSFKDFRKSAPQPTYFQNIYQHFHRQMCEYFIVFLMFIEQQRCKTFKTCALTHLHSQSEKIGPESTPPYGFKTHDPGTYILAWTDPGAWQAPDRLRATPRGSSTGTKECQGAACKSKRPSMPCSRLYWPNAMYYAMLGQKW